MVELDELLHTIYLLVHLGLDELRIFLLPLPQRHLLLGRSGGLAERNDQGSIGVDIQREHSFWMWIEDGLARGA